MSERVVSIPRPLRAFMDDCGWPTPKTQIEVHRMTVAYSCFAFAKDAWLPLGLDSPVYVQEGYNAFQLHSKRAGDRPTNLSTWMQAVDFTQPVYWLVLPERWRLVAHTKPFAPAQPPKRTPRWFAPVGTAASRLALPPSPRVPRHFVVKSRVWGLLSTSGDLLVDWEARPRRDGRQLTSGEDYHYRHGGGLQFFVPDSEGNIRPVE